LQGLSILSRESTILRLFLLQSNLFEFHTHRYKIEEVYPVLQLIFFSVIFLTLWFSFIMAHLEERELKAIFGE
jgi:hypothetical protein